MTDSQPLFTPEDLGHWLGTDVDDARGAVLEEVVWGWLRPVLAVDGRPDPLSPELRADALELGGIAHENPAGLSSKQYGDVSEEYSGERRDEILERVAQRAGTPAAGRPRGRFPKARPYPDAAESCAPR